MIMVVSGNLFLSRAQVLGHVGNRTGFDIQRV